MEDISRRPVVIVESPFAGDVEVNKRYAIKACADCFARGEAPFASHLLYPQILDDHAKIAKTDRETGITSGYAFWPIARLIAFYIDRGWSPGMQRAKERAVNLGYRWEERTIKEQRKTK
jgi:hypothetical protein